MGGKIQKRLLIIDFNNAKFNLKDKSLLETNGTLDIKIDNKVVKGIRASQFQMPTEKILMIHL